MTPAPVVPSPDIGVALVNLCSTLIAGRVAPEVPHTPQKPLTRAENPKTPFGSHTPFASPVIPSPDDIPRFLHFARNRFGISAAPTFKEPLRRLDFGPDILLQAPDSALTGPDCNITPGNVIRLKAACRTWLQTSREEGGKRKRAEESWSEGKEGNDDDEEDDDDNPFKVPRPEDDHRIVYERKWPESDVGGNMFTADLPVPGVHKEEDDRLFVWSELWQKQIPLPDGLTAFPTDEEREAAKNLKTL